MKNLWDFKNEIRDSSFNFFEDGMIEYIFESLEKNNINFDKNCIEFGANDGVFLSNTRNLILKGWNSIQIEANESFYNKLKNLYINNNNVVCKQCYVESDANSPNSYENIVTNIYGVDAKISFLSIDIDGYDFSIFKNINKHLPLLFIIENNSHLESFKNEGLTSITNLAKEKGYELLAYTGNSFFIKKEYFKFLNLKAQTPESAFKRYWEECTQEDKKYLVTVFNPLEFWKR